jgi:hypothetical protein
VAERTLGVAQTNARLKKKSPNANAEEEICRLNQELEQQSLSERPIEAAIKSSGLVYSVSRPGALRHIDGFLKLLKRTTTLLDESQHYMATISETQSGAWVLIDDLLSFTWPQ